MPTNIAVTILMAIYCLVVMWMASYFLNDYVNYTEGGYRVVVMDRLAYMYGANPWYKDDSYAQLFCLHYFGSKWNVLKWLWPI